MRHWLNDTNRDELAECFNCSPSEVEARLDEQKAKASRVPSHPLNPETQDHAVASFLGWAGEDFHRASIRTGERRLRSLQSATGNMGLAAFSAERAAVLRGHRFSLLPNRDRSIDEAFARYEADERRPAQGIAA